MGVGKLMIGIIIPLSIFGCVSTEICSVYNNVQILKNNDKGSNSYVRSYNLEENGELSINIEIQFECKVIIFNAENVTHISKIRLENTANHKIYTTDDYSTYENIILKISFAENVPPGSYKINFDYNSEINSPAVLSEWIMLTNFDDDHVDEKNSNATRVWLRKSALGHGKYLVKNVESLLEAFENFIGFSYNKNKYVKLDLFVVPQSPKSKHRRGEFIYVDEEIFVNEDNIATNNAEQLYRTIVEMMINQAFEGYNPPQVSPFSRLAFTLRKYLVYLITDKAIPSWHLQDEYARLLRYSIFESDYLFSHLHAYDMFDSYPNNGLVLRMIEHAAGKEFFSNSLKTYLQNRTAVYTTNFFTVLMTEMSGDRKDFLENIFTSWINNIGYPIVTITRDYGNNSAIITQSRFLRNSNKISIIRHWIALNNATQENADFDDTTVTMWFDPKIESLEIVTPPPDQWVICNKQQFGYYRVNYDEKNWKLITDYLKSGNYQKIHVLNRAQLIDDAFVFAEFGYLNFNVAFDLARYLKIETEYVPWATFWEKMFRLYQYSSISGSQYYEPFKVSIKSHSNCSILR
ncbi:Similar to APN1: Aminopeptidase N (Plutella xylostella) [Cotesia congregata]|uniref:Similar to APN1: Aminopeptidase N (Plutella xylostella) n=1 Tax=Cotesia congregata TaxID=51543 RepID=A0A8J2HI16_COTCN|nr:Similar to APN1: Aminopeptidase N (Plutella xylostella) [Cotesia congregata]